MSQRSYWAGHKGWGISDVPPIVGFFGKLFLVEDNQVCIQVPCMAEGCDGVVEAIAPLPDVSGGPIQEIHGKALCPICKTEHETVYTTGKAMVEVYWTYLSDSEPEQEAAP